MVKMSGHNEFYLKKIMLNFGESYAMYLITRKYSICIRKNYLCGLKTNCKDQIFARFLRQNTLKEFGQVNNNSIL